MAEENKPEQDLSAVPATKKKPAAKKAAKKKAAKKKAGAKTTAKKTAAKKTPRKKAPAKRASVATPAQAEPAAAPEAIPRTAPQPPPVSAALDGGQTYGADAGSGGMSGLLVTAGPLIILGFLILVMSNDRTVDSVSAIPAATAPIAEAPADVSDSGLTEESLKQLVTDGAAKDLAAAFKEAGVEMPANSLKPAPAAASQPIEIPKELQNNPWAPQPPDHSAADTTIPPPPAAPEPGYNNQAAGPGYPRGSPQPWGYRGQMRGYNPYMNPYMNPYRMGYPWQPPPAYGMPMNPYAGSMPGYGMPQGGAMGGGGMQPAPAQGVSPPAPAATETKPAPG